MWSKHNHPQLRRNVKWLFKQNSQGFQSSMNMGVDGGGWDQKL